jgi:hypothetical protein
MNDLIRRLHAHAPPCVLAITGGGAGVMGQLLAAPGGSRWLLEAVVPYSAAALVDFLATPIEQACSPAASDLLAARALERARWLAPGQPVLGLGATASLASDRPKKGDHRIHVSSASDERDRRWSLILAKDARDRAAEEGIAANLILQALATAAGLSDLPSLTLLPEESVQFVQSERVCLTLSANPVERMSKDGRLQVSGPVEPGAVPALLPGAFNPLHEGHWALAEEAERFLGKPVAFELSLANVDKPDLKPWDVRQRLTPFAGRAEVWITRAARFTDKASLFPGTIFVVGADTALRIVDPKYYGGEITRLKEALACLRAEGCRFLVACRRDDTGRCWSRADVAVPEGFSDLFLSLPAERFLLDLSSTGLRARSFEA